MARWGNAIPGREFLKGLVIVGSREALARGAEVAGAVNSQSSRNLHPGPGQLGSSEDAGRADGARCETENGS